MIDLSQYKLVQGLQNTNPTVDEVRGMNGTAAVMRINSLIDQLQNIAQESAIEDINFFIEVPHQKHYTIDLSNSSPKIFRRITAVNGFGECNVSLVVGNTESPALGVTDQTDYILFDLPAPIEAPISLRVSAIDNAQDLSVSIVYERVIPVDDLT